MKIIVFLLTFLILGALFIINNNNLVLEDPQNIKEFSRIYINWLDKLFINVQKITGNIISVDWLP
jgi:hypothetical protein